MVEEKQKKGGSWTVLIWAPLVIGYYIGFASLLNYYDNNPEEFKGRVNDFLGRFTEDRIVGTWEFSQLLTQDNFAAAGSEVVSEGVEVELALTGSTTYHEGGRATSDGLATFRLFVGEYEPTLRFSITLTSEWRLSSDRKEIIETYSDSKLIPLDQSTAEILRSSPEIAETLRPMKGETITAEILSLSDDLMVVKDKEFGLTTTYTRSK